MLPFRRTFGEESGETLVRVTGFQEMVEVKPFDLVDAPLHLGDKSAAGGFDGAGERGGALVRKVGVEVGEGRGLGVIGDRVKQAERLRFRGVDRTARKEQVFGGALPDARRQEAGSRRSEYAELDLGLTELRQPAPVPVLRPGTDRGRRPGWAAASRASA